MGLRQLRHSNHSTGKFACSVSDTDALSSESCSAPSDWNVYKISATTSATACKAEDCPAGHRCWHFDQVHSSITPSYLLYIWSYSHNYGYICQDQWEFQDPKVGTVAYKVLKAYTLNFSPYKGLTKTKMSSNQSVPEMAIDRIISYPHYVLLLMSILGFMALGLSHLTW